MRKIFFSGIILFLFYSCATFYEINLDFNRSFESGQLEKADEIIAKNKKYSEGKDRLLYWLNRGTVNSIIGEYELSNQLFEQAYIFGEDHHKNYLYQAASFFTNPGVTVYAGEDHENLLLLYFKAINYMMLNDLEAAMVEVRRMNNRLYQLSDKYGTKNKFKEDAFSHTLMGIIYEADKGYNDAFIAYRNAYNIYKDYYSNEFNVNVPEQLKKDLIRSAHLSGFWDEKSAYENEFQMKYEPEDPDNGALVFFWNNGLGPIKDEWSINFTLIRDRVGFIYFENAEYGLSFPFPLGNEYNAENFGDLEMIRVAFPKYVERPILFNQAFLAFENQNYQLDLAEDINQIAFKTLEERMLKEFATSLARLAVKKVVEYEFSKEDDALGAAVGILNAFTEKADTRNWQTLPHSIYYSRISLSPGKHNLKFLLDSPHGNQVNQSHDINVDISSRKTQFYTFYSLEYLY